MLVLGLQQIGGLGSDAIKITYIFEHTKWQKYDG